MKVSGNTILPLLVAFAELAKLSEACGALSDSIVDLKSELKKLNDFVLSFVYVPLSENTEAIKELKPALVKHKHAAGSGEAMLPMEALQ